jgi:SlyX protein
MADAADLTARIERLETHVAHQAGTIADLDKVVTAQWAEIDRLKRLISELTDRLGDTEARVDEALPQKRPPHY